MECYVDHILHILNSVWCKSEHFSVTVDLTTKMNSDSLNEIDEDLEVIRKKEKEQVRDFIERLVNVMLGENVDDASISKVYNDSHCK